MGNKDLGYILLWRSFFRSGFWRERRTFSKAEAWIDLFSSACYTPQQEQVGNIMVTVERGELMASVRFLAGRWKWGIGTVHDFLKRLKDENMIETRTPDGTQATIIAICNYEELTSPPSKAELPSEHHSEHQPEHLSEHRSEHLSEQNGQIDGTLSRTPDAPVTDCEHEKYSDATENAEHHPEHLCGQNQQDDRTPSRTVIRTPCGTPSRTNINKGRNKGNTSTDRERILSVCKSFRAGTRVTPGDVVGIYEVFFFKNFVRPAAEAETFINHYEATGWVRSGQPVSNIVALAETWEQRREGPVRFPQGFLAAWEEIYEMLKGDGVADAITLLYDVLSVSIDERERIATIGCSAALRTLVEENSRKVSHVWYKHNPNTKIRWQIRY